MPDELTVFIVVYCSGAGNVAGVFSTLAKASEYVDAHKYGSFIISEHTVDSDVVKV